MRKILLTISFVLALLPLQAQQVEMKQDGVVVIPSHIAEKVILDLEEKDRLVVELNKADSVIRVYEMEIASRGQLVREMKLTVDEYTVLVEKLETEMDNMAKDYSKSKKENRQKIRNLQLKNALVQIIAIGELVLIILLIV
jgi:hypothetical protein